MFPSGEDGFDELSPNASALGAVKYNMRKSLNLDQEGCYLQAGNRGCLEECGFNATTKTIFIIHGWTVAECFCMCCVGTPPFCKPVVWSDCGCVSLLDKWDFRELDVQASLCGDAARNRSQCGGC